MQGSVERLSVESSSAEEHHPSVRDADEIVTTRRNADKTSPHCTLMKIMLVIFAMTCLFLHPAVAESVDNVSQVEGECADKSPPPGLYTALDKKLTPIPEKVRLTVCK